MDRESEMLEAFFLPVTGFLAESRALARVGLIADSNVNHQLYSILVSVAIEFSTRNLLFIFILFRSP